MKVTFLLDDETVNILKKLTKEKLTGSMGRTIEYITIDYDRLNNYAKTLESNLTFLQNGNKGSQKNHKVKI